MCAGSSRRSYKINTRFDVLVHCSECQTSRAMAIKTIQPGMSGSRDEIVYQCTQCGAENVEVCRIALSHLPTQEDPRGKSNQLP
jgi:hypothetical protein